MKKYDMIIKNKLTLLFPVVSVFAVLFLSGCWGGGNEDSKLVVINVLDKKYYDDCHIKGSIHIPFESLEGKFKSLNKKDRYVFYCSNYACTAAPFSAMTMKDAGFDHVSVYHGGIVEWHKKGYPCTGPAKLSYLKEENEPLGEDEHDSVPALTAEALKSQMEQAGLLK